MLSKSLVQNDHIMSSLVDDNAHMFTWNVHGKRILVYPVDYNKQFNVTCTHPEELSDKETASGDSAAAIGKFLFQIALLRNLASDKLCSVQSESLFRYRFKHLRGLRTSGQKTTRNRGSEWL